MKRTQILSLKYRPHSLLDVIGQDVLVQTLTNAIQSNRMPHAILLTGIRGIGKTSTARIIALSMNCEMHDAPSVNPCGKCRHCTSIIKSAHEDVVEIDAASHTGVENIKLDIIESSYYKPLSARYKVFIIDEVHMLSKHAFNALLKILEEPPQNVFFILATTEIKKVPVTIVSRCYSFVLARISIGELSKHLINITQQEGISISDQAASMIANYSGGSVRDALMILDSTISYIGINNKDVEINDQLVRRVIGRGNIEEALDITSNILAGDVQKSLDGWNKLYISGVDPYYFIEDMMETLHIMTCMCMNIKMNHSNTPYSQNFITQAENIVQNYSSNILVLLWQVLSRAVPESKNTDQSNRFIDMLIIKLIHIRNAHTNTLESKSPVVAEHKNNIHHTSTPNPDTKIDITSFKQLVQVFCDKKHMLIYNYLHNKVKLVEFTPGQLALSTVEAIPSKLLSELKHYLHIWTGQSWKVEITEQSEGRLTLNEQKQNQERLNKEKLRQHPDIKSIMQCFPGSEITEFSHKE